MKIPFGKYYGKTIDEVLGDDPSYLVWLDENTDFDVPEYALENAYEYIEDSMEPDLDCVLGDDWGDRS
tara:strand:+ start:70126 stop:70329 length:204 start_codon:yes stop_codon:yes gene_type:complete